GAALFGGALAGTAHKNGARVAPERLGEREAKIAPCEPDVREHAIVQARQGFEVAAMAKALCRARHACDQKQARCADRVQERRGYSVRNSLFYAHGNLQ